MGPRPDFFIVGAPKCGTTALYRYLAAQPGVFMPENKEPSYFCTDLPRYGHVATSAEYQALFAPAPPHALTGEASALYLYSKDAVARIVAHNPDARIIAILRNPIEAARSMHAFQCNYDLEDVWDFEQAWRLQEARRQGQHLPPRWPYPDHLQYGPLYSYATQVSRLLAQVPRTRCLFLVFEEFFSDPSRGFAGVLEFLGLPPAPAGTSFPVVNQTLGARSPRLQQLLRHPPGAFRPLRRAAHALGLHPLRALQTLNRAAGRKPSLRKAFRAELEDYFAGDVARLEQLLGRKLWPSGRDTAPLGAARGGT
jgi:hypothetical protein